MSEKKIFPHHVAIILDGNGRWAQKRGRKRTFGHKAGAANVKVIVRAAAHMGIKRLTLYAFSTENWKRPSLEVNFLMRLFKHYLIGELHDLIKDNVRVHIVGDVTRLSESLQKEIQTCENDTAHNDGLVLNVAINYGGRMEIIRGIKSMIDDVRTGKLKEADVTETTMENYLYPSVAEDVDLLIRTGGESRISNFLLWQTSYSELYFTPVLWPDFTEAELKKAICWYTGRDRRFGGLTGETT